MNKPVDIVPTIGRPRRHRDWCERLDVEDGGLEARKLTLSQLRTIKSLWERSSEPRYREFRRRVMPLVGLYSRAHGGWVTVQWAGINLTIDPQGYTYVRGAA